MQHGSKSKHYPLETLQVQHATATVSPVNGLVRVIFDITIEEAYRIGYLCDGSTAGFAGAVDQAAFWARYGKPTEKAFLPTHAEARALRRLSEFDQMDGQLELFPLPTTTSDPGE